MEIQTLPLDDMDHHTLDAMVEYGELDCGAYLAIILYADRGEISDILHIEDHYGWRERVTTRFTELGNLIISQLPIEQQGHIAHAAFVHGIRTLRTAAPILADWALTDQCEGGALQPFKRYYRHLNDYRLPNRTRRKLYSRKWIKRYVRNNMEAQRLKGTLFVRIFDRMFALQQKYVVDGSEAIGALMAWQLAHTPVTPLRPSRGAVGAEARKVLQRSLRAAKAVVPADTLKAFINREEISVRGKNLMLKVKRTGSLVSVGHGSFAVSVCDLEGVLLANLCVYFEDTPALDQLIGLMLYVSSGCEAEFIAAANVTYLTEAGKNNSLVVPKDLVAALERSAERSTVVRTGRRPHLSIPGAALSRRRDDYWNDTRVVWANELSKYVLGHSAWFEEVDMYT